MTIQPKNNNLNYLIDPSFTNANRLFVLSFARNILGNKRDSFSHYYVPNVDFIPKILMSQLKEKVSLTCQ